MSNAKSLVPAVVAILIGASTPAWAIDGCKVLLCLSGPWQSIPACVDEVDQLFRDLWSGNPFPRCNFAAGAGYTPNVANAPNAGTASASNVWLAQWAPAPDPNCPPQYVTVAAGIRRTTYGCRYVGTIPVRINGQLWSTTYWTMAGSNVTQFSAYAGTLGVVQGALLGTEFPTFSAAQAAGAAAAPPAVPAGSGGGG
jgi:hypothetical protein